MPSVHTPAQQQLTILITNEFCCWLWGHKTIKCFIGKQTHCTRDLATDTNVKGIMIFTITVMLKSYSPIQIHIMHNIIGKVRTPE